MVTSVDLRQIHTQQSMPFSLTTTKRYSLSPIHPDDTRKTEYQRHKRDGRFSLLFLIRRQKKMAHRTAADTTTTTIATKRKIA